jgi:hypothetical protein
VQDISAKPMSKFARKAASVYLGTALAVLGLQLPQLLDICGSASKCLASFSRAPLWASFWPLYFLELFATPTVGQVFAYVGMPLATAIVITIAWEKIRDRETSQWRSRPITGVQ